MISRIVPLKKLSDAGRWRAAVYLHGDDDIVSTKYTVKALADVVQESTTATSPSEFRGGRFYYIGLEHVEPITGDPIDVAIVGPGEVRSRSKVFKRGDVLFARLRPYLRKVLLVEEPFMEGLCSTEFIVLRPRSTSVSASFLRALLSSRLVAEHLGRFQAGAALPRISAKDLLTLKIPVPKKTIQDATVARLEKLKHKRQAIKQQLIDLADEQENIINGFF